MDSFFEQLLNGTYQEGQKVLTAFFGVAPYRSTIVKFGGFQFSHNWYGKTDLIYDKVGDRPIVSKTIYLNSLFLSKQFSLVKSEQFQLKKMINTISHELAHCLLADYHPSLANQHDWLHELITAVLEYFLWNTYEMNMLEKLSKHFCLWMNQDC